jgi:hypothetical protein
VIVTSWSCLHVPFYWKLLVLIMEFIELVVFIFVITNQVVVYVYSQNTRTSVEFNCDLAVASTLKTHNFCRFPVLFRKALREI